MYSVIVLGLALVFVLTSLDIFKNREDEKFGKYIKILAVSFSIIGVLKFLLSDAFVELVIDFADPYQSFLRWTYYIGYAVLPISIFFKSRLFRNIAIYFSLPISIIAALSFNDTMAYYLMDGAYGLRLLPAIRYAYYIIELALAVSVPVLTLMHTKHVFNVKDKKEWLTFFAAIPLMMLQMMPAYMPQSLIGYTGLDTASFSTIHLGWIILLIIEGFVLHFVFRGKSEENKYILLVFLTIAQFFHTNSIFLRGFTLSRLPLQLCSIAAYFYLYLIITRSKKLFNFCFLVNLIGGAVAIALAAFTPEWPLGFWNLHYIYEHTFVMLIPILGLSLGIFEAPIKKESLLTAIKIFTIYFLASFVIGEIMNAANPGDVYVVNFFYMFNMKVALEYIPFAGFAGAIHWVVGEFEAYPILIAVIYTVFTSIFALFFLIMKLSCNARSKAKAKKAEKAEAIISA